MSDNNAISSLLEENYEKYERIVLDVHTHHTPPQPEGIIAFDPADLPDEGVYPRQYYSVGLHPWTLQGASGASADRLEALREGAERQDVVAIGETGFDTVHAGGAPLAGQMNAFRAHVELSEALRKPLIIHCVKGQEMILGIKKSMQPKQPWIIHGFRGKTSVLDMFVSAGIYVSFGRKFNPDSLVGCPADRILAETDDTPGRIEDVIGALNAVRADVTPDLIAANLRRVIFS